MRLTRLAPSALAPLVTTITVVSSALARSRALVLSVSLLVAGCATVSPAQRSHFDSTSRQLAGQSVPMVIDACVIRNEIGARYILRKATLDAGVAASRVAQQHLRDHGLRSDAVITPFLCGTPWFSNGQAPSEIAETVDDARSPTGTFPLRSTDRIWSNTALTASYRQLLSEVARVQPDNGSLQPRPLGMSREQTAMLIADVGSSKTWILQIGGTQVSAAKTMGIGMLTGMATVLTFGVGFMTMPVDGIGYQLALVDLQNQQIVWQKPQPSLQGDPGDTDSFDTKWAQAAFTPFIDPKSTALAGEPRSNPPPSPATMSAPAAPVRAESAEAVPQQSSPVRAPEMARVALGPGTIGSVAPLRSRPMSSDPPFAQIPPRSALDVQSQMRNSDGNWVYVRASADAGWIPAEFISSP